MSLVDQIIEASKNYVHKIPPGFYWCEFCELVIIYDDFRNETFGHYPTRGETEKDDRWLSGEFYSEWYYLDRITKKPRMEYLGPLDSCPTSVRHEITDDVKPQDSRGFQM